MKKLFFAVQIMSLLAAGCNSSKQVSVQTAAPSPIVQDKNLTASSTYQDTLDWKTFNNDDYGFIFQYPADYSLYNGSEATLDSQLYIPVESNIPPLVTVAMPKNTYPSNTDFEGGYFTVIEDTQLNQTQCTDIMFEPTLKNVQHKKQVTINAITYAEGSDGGVGGGHQAEDEFFMTFHNNICFRLQEGTRTGGYGDSDAITKQVDVNDVFAKLYLVTQTFKFTK